jgi:hypothetical protein
MSEPNIYSVVDNMLAAMTEMAGIVRDLNPGMNVTHDFIDDSLSNAWDQLQIIKRSIPTHSRQDAE